MSHYEISGSGRVKENLLLLLHTPQAPPEYISRTKVEVVIKNDRLEELSHSLQKNYGRARRKNIC